MSKVYYVYILLCSDDTLYTGYTVDISRRLEEHNSSSKGAKYTKSRRPVKLLYFETYKTKTEAMKREYQIKRLKREEKMNLIDMRTV